MMMASSIENKGFEFNSVGYDHGVVDNSMNNFDSGFFDDIDFGGVNNGGGGGFDDDIGIDMDSFFTILDELPSKEQPLGQLPINSFYSSMDYTQESVSAADVGNTHDLHSLLDYGAASQSSAETAEVLEQACFVSPPHIAVPKGPSFGKNNSKPALCHTPKFMETQCFPPTQNCLNIYDISVGCPNQNHIAGVDYGMPLTKKANKDVLNPGLYDSQSSHSWIDNKTILDAPDGAANMSPSEVPMYDFCNSIVHDDYPFDRMDTFNTFDSSSTTTDEASAEPYCWGLTDQSSVKEFVEMKVENNVGLGSLNSFEGKSFRKIKGDSFGEPSLGGLVGHQNDYSLSYSTERKPIISPLLNSPVSSARFGDLGLKRELDAVGQPRNMENVKSYGSNEACAASLSDNKTYSEVDDNDDDDDVCIIEDLSAPVKVHQLAVHKKSVTSHMPTFFPGYSPSATPLHEVGVSGTRFKAPDESLIFQAVVQDLSQPKSEATPPDGVMEVPLMKHQRIALSWMVQKETTSVQCSGGILADDQGLGKTISTISLILTERAPLARTLVNGGQGEPVTLDLDKEDDKLVRNGASTNGVQSSSSVRGRPSGGTLIVCPTSVIRQWGDELKNKVADKVKLSVCMYHGSSRTKDPYELANYDVVLTTYAIVSMEVPKPVTAKDDNDDDPFGSSRKRKHSSKSDKKRLKKRMEDGFFETSSRPLARVNWFRVVLDEAQSIKNYRTQVAQACWGLRAKRRWCLSGTPIQNSVDDLYSYFRFLRYDPYSVYKSFRSMVKLPIAKNPSNGYKKLQVVLKTIMLRRTKGTLLDGEPIINLPPKFVKLKKVEFSEEERDFYTRLEADSRAQFQEYAASGTVKQNYVNILLMLLRLRQACDHPFLVRGYGSNSVLKSSIHAAKKLPRERQISLLNCLEASLAICGICSDPPEDAVVSICGHVFCNQCVSECLTGDENQCPATNCKSTLNLSSVFSKGALKSCLSVDSSPGSSQICSAPESFEQAEGLEPSSCFNSSKIKTALSILKYLSKPRTTIHDDVSMESSVTDVGCFDKSSSTSASSVNEIPVTSKGSAKSNSGVIEKAIVFSQWTSMLDLLEDGLKESSLCYRRLDGTMSVAARDKAVKDFNTLPEVSVVIMSLKAASLGLNMVAACHVILLDLWWNPTTEDQAIDRAHRIGQTRPVTVVRLTVKNTVEDRILSLQQKKRELVASAFGEDETGTGQTRLTVEDLEYLFMA